MASAEDAVQASETTIPLSGEGQQQDVQIEAEEVCFIFRFLSLSTIPHFGSCMYKKVRRK